MASRIAQFGRRAGPKIGTALFYTTGLGLVVYTVDEVWYEHTLLRNTRTLWAAANIAYDYRFNFNPDDPASVAALHQRNAQRLLHVCKKNQGMYTKLAQAVGTQAAILPPPYAILSQLLDRAQPLDKGQARKVIERELGAPVDTVFDGFDDAPVAAASIAQVHRATLKSNGAEVAIKVQRPAIRKQAYWDLMCFRLLLRLQERIFGVPFAFAGTFISNEIQNETHFLIEIANSQHMNQYLQSDPHLRKNVYIPKVYNQYCTDRLIVMEYISGAVKMTDIPALEQMGIQKKYVMQTVVETFASMIFKWGFIQCDGHPSNVLVRQHPENPKQHQVVLIDHGLVIKLTPEFRRQYCSLWKAITLLDVKTIQAIAKEWGIGNTDLFASATIMRPFRRKQTPEQIAKAERRARMSDADLQREAKEALKNFLFNQQAFPLELIMVGRSMRIIQAANQALGSPVNRLKINAQYAAAGVVNTLPPSAPWSLKVKDRFELLNFKFAMLALDLAFYISSTLYALKRLWPFSSSKGGGFEDALETQMKRIAKSDLGVDLPDAAFVG